MSKQGAYSAKFSLVQFSPKSFAKEQYEENIATKKGSKNVVEFAIKLPSDGAGTVYLPVDSKFPGDTYSALRDAVKL